jgi:two-component system, LytTR family, response regulator
MNEITTVLIDEERSLSILILLIKRHCPNLRIVGVAKTVDRAIELINETKPSLIILEVELQDGNGFDILKKINHFHYEVIITTTQNKHAVKAFEISALHYLIKPITPEQLRNAVNRFSFTNCYTNLDEKFKILKESLSENCSKILLPTFEGLSVFNISEIVRCEADGNYTTIYFNNHSNILVSKPIKIIDQILSDQHFSRVHNKHLVNLKYIERYVKGRKSYLILSNQESIPISETKRNQFVTDLENYAKHI